MSNLRRVNFEPASVDAFGRLRISSANTLFDSQFQYNTGTVFQWNESVSGAGASVTHLPDESSVKLTLGTVSGEKIIRQTKRYIRYQPGKSQFCAMTGVMGALKTNVRQRIGIFDDNNGLFFEQDGSNLKVVRRTYTSGSAVDNSVSQSSWNIDPLDGTGASGITLDMSKSQIFIIDFQWLGVGRVRYGFDIDGILYYCHEVLNANNLSTVYMTTANLPVRYEIENTGVAASSTDMIQICSSVASESGFSDERSTTLSVATGTTTINIGTLRPIISIKPKNVFGSSTAIINRSEVVPDSFGGTANTNSVYYELIYNGTLTTPSWSDPSTNCVFEYDVTSTGVSGGEIIDSGFIMASNTIKSAVSDEISHKINLCNTLDGTTSAGLPDVLTLAMATIGGSTSTTVSGSLTAKQIL